MNPRPLHLGDVIAAARALRAVKAEDRAGLLDTLFTRAAAAHRHVRATGHLHRDFGDGSLMAAAFLAGVVAEPSLDDADYRSCLVAVLGKI